MALPVELQRNEQVVGEFQRHPYFLIKQLILITITGVGPVLILIWLAGFIGFLADIAQPLAIVWAIGAIIAGLIAFYGYENDRWFITNQRLIDVTKRNVFNTTVSSAELVNILDMTIRQRGVIANTFNFGDVECQTAGSGRVFAMRGVENPPAALNMIDSTRHQARINLKQAAAEALSPN